MFQTEKKENQNKYLGPTQNRTAICRIRICCANHYTMGPFGPFVWVFPDEQGVQIDYASFHESWPHVSIEFGRNFVCHTSIARVINRRFTPYNVQSAQIPGNTPLSLYSIRSSEMLENTLSWEGTRPTRHFQPSGASWKRVSERLSGVQRAFVTQHRGPQARRRDPAFFGAAPRRAFQQIGRRAG